MEGRLRRCSLLHRDVPKPAPHRVQTQRRQSYLECRAPDVSTFCDDYWQVTHEPPETLLGLRRDLGVGMRPRFRQSVRPQPHIDDLRLVFLQPVPAVSCILSRLFENGAGRAQSKPGSFRLGLRHSARLPHV